MGTWTNDDGLYIKYGPTEVTVVDGGEILAGQGDVHLLEFDLDYTTVDDSATAGATIVGDNVIIPKGAIVERIQIFTETAWDSAGDAFVMNMGTVQLDRSTEIDFNGLLAAIPQADMNAAGEFQEVIVGHTYAGADIGVVGSSTYAGLITVDYDTAAPTAGKSKFRVFYHMPTS